MVVYGLGVFGIGFDYVTSICKEIKDYKAKQNPPEKYDKDFCMNDFRMAVEVSYIFGVVIKAYFSYILCLWSKKKAAPD